MLLGRPVLLTMIVIALGAAVLHAQDRPTDQWLTKPVDDRTFAAYLQFFAYDATLPFETVVLDSTEQEGIKVEHVKFQSTPGVMVTARLYRPAGASTGSVVLLHGGSPQGKDGSYMVRFARVYARAGFTTLAIDFQHFGERDDGFFTTFAEIEKHDRLYNNKALYLDWVAQTVKDVSRSFDFLVKERGADPERVALSGFSRGAVLATIAGAADPRFAAVTLLHVGHFDYYETGHQPAACPANYIGRISPRPLFILSATHDGDFLPETAIKPLQRLAKDPVTIRWTDGTHGFTNDQDLGAAIEWLRGVLR
ncbi:MAG: alpha/beta fold hydrolase [Gemmatimonadota bacterium]|jgi:dienelactone hydrolase